MNYEIRIKVSGKCENGLTVTSESKAVIPKEETKDAIGKFLYAVECMGFNFKTSDIYDNVIEKYDEDAIDSRFNRFYRMEASELSLEVAVRCV